MMKTQLLRLLMFVALFFGGVTTKSAAKPFLAGPGLDYYIFSRNILDTRWQVIEINGTPLPPEHSAIIIRFEDDAAYVEQGCLAFKASPEIKNIYIEYVQDAETCASLSPQQKAMATIFENFSSIAAINDNKIHLYSLNEHELIATRFPVINGIIPPVRWPISIVYNQALPLTVILNGPQAFRSALGNCQPDISGNSGVAYWFEISWGDGTTSNLQNNPEGIHCHEVLRHTYARPGKYHISVRVTTLGPDDAVRLIYSGENVATLE